MTKEQYDNYDKDIFCNRCQCYFPKNKIEHKCVLKDGHSNTCNVCGWIKRNGMPDINGLPESDIRYILHYFLNDPAPTINHVALKYDITIDECITLYKKLNIKGKKICVECRCGECDKALLVSPSVYLKNENHFCSSECYHKYQAAHIKSGKDSPFYKRIHTCCDNCGKAIDVISSKYNMLNSYGETHNFCSHECYSEFRSKYYVGEKSNMYDYDYPDELRDKMRLICLNNSRKSDRFNSGIQLIINNLLEKNGIKFEREYIFGYYAVDNYLVEHNLIIEIMGDYWHASPLRYGDGLYKINNIQRKTILKDKQKRSYILNHNNINILYLWENDINNNIDLCDKLIANYINNHGLLSNYHSFNWTLLNGILVENKDIIVPFQDVSSKEYEKYLSNK